MRKKLYIYLLFLLIISTNIVFGNGSNKAKIAKLSQAKHNNVRLNDRMKRSLYDEDERNAKKLNGGQKYYNNYKLAEDYENKLMKESPFWKNRGKRYAPTQDKIYDIENPIPDFSSHPAFPNKYCKTCFTSNDRYDEVNENVKYRREDIEEPFWGNRGRRSNEESEDLSPGPFWGNRGKKQDDEPFWGTRGRRQDESPFWGNRGRRDDEPFWGNRGRRQDTPFWGNRGRRDTTEPFWANRGRREESEPFWGNRGRRKDSEPFWGNRGRRQESEPFWGNRGRRVSDTFWGNHGRGKQEIEESLLDAMEDVQGNIENLSRLKSSNSQPSFWANRSRDSRLKNMYSETVSARLPHLPNMYNTRPTIDLKGSAPGTVHDNQMYAEEPHYIIVERSSRSSTEDDPYFISRGKKYSTKYDLSQTERDRRGAIEEIVKSVRNDPYYIARGKKDLENIKGSNSTDLHDKFQKAKELICSTIELISIKNGGNKTKRELDDNDRDRRTILKKLAAQLQIDPYYVSRGKKSEETNTDDHLEDFINEINIKCN
ncbi:uncharacterized protein LOC113516606 [Galleria mellonella]|uniref:Natalisin n=1 Tax=Galleria mellonella TaxID=7137 RepID=A0A6J1WVL1_GALME|nr:uncharacterized protein LOC113516606 [Galleria mellonella]WLY76854.1 natalisin [Galleria mellonella]